LSPAFNAIIVLIAAGPVLAFSSGPLVALCQMLIVAAGVAAMARAARAMDIDQFGRAVAGAPWFALLVPLLIVVQLLPLPLGLSHPIWLSAHEALQTHAMGQISADLSATVRALFSALTALALVVVTIVVGRDRRRAELLLLAISAVTTLLAASVLAQNVAALKAAFASSMPAGVATLFCACGVVINLAVIQLAFERRETRHAAASPFIPIGIGGLLGALVNAGALAETGGAAGGTAAAFGVVLFALILIIRRLDLTVWAIAVLCAATLVGAAIMVAWLAAKNSATPALLRLLPEGLSASQAVIERMLAEARWLGSGAGTFQAVSRLYQGSDATGPVQAPTAAVKVAVELGWVGLASLVAISCALLVKLFRGALQRGRDSFFPAAAASCVATASFAAFADSGLLQPAVVSMLAVLIGLGLAQGYSQSARQ